jgi:hypothetical protein
MTAKISLLLAYDDIEAASGVLDVIRQSPEYGDAVRIDFEKAESRVEARRKKG